MAEPDRDAIIALARRLTTPVDVPALLADGVIRHRGPWWRRWYEVLDARRLPEWAVCQISAMRRGPHDTVLVRFARRNAVAAHLLAELTAQGAPAARATAAERATSGAG